MFNRMMSIEGVDMHKNVKTLIALFVGLIAAFFIVYLYEAKRHLDKLDAQKANMYETKLEVEKPSIVAQPKLYTTGVKPKADAAKADKTFVWRPGIDPTPVSYDRKGGGTLFGSEGQVGPMIRFTTFGEERNTLEGEMKSLKQTQDILKQQLDLISKQLATLEVFSTAQKALQLTWVKLEKPQVVSNAFNVDLNQQKLQICRASFMNGIHPGVVKPEGCLITYGGSSAIIQSYEVLTANVKTEWKKVDSIIPYQKISSPTDNTLWQNKSIPLQIGYENQIPLYVCKVNYNNQAYIGKVIGSNCNFAVGPKEIYLPVFEVLFGEKNE